MAKPMMASFLNRGRRLVMADRRLAIGAGVTPARLWSRGRPQAGQHASERPGPLAAAREAPQCGQKELIWGPPLATPRRQGESDRGAARSEIGRESCRERVEIS